jgi:hypothetical protein
VRSRLPVDPALILVVACLAAGEIALRASRDARREARALDGYYPPPHVFDREVGYRYRPRHRGRFVRADFDTIMVTNNHGFRGPDFERAKPAGRYRVALLGDSLLAANQVQIEQTWAYLLERRLRAVAGRRVEVLNFGVDGYRCWNEGRLLVESVLGYGPDAVVLWADEAVLRNPFELYRTTSGDTILASYDPDLLLATASREAAQALAPGTLLLRHSRLSRWFVRRLGKNPVDSANFRWVAGGSTRRHRLESLIAGMADACRGRGAGFGLFYRNRRPSPDRDPCVPLGIPVASDDALFPTYRGLTFARDAHLDVAGNRRYADSSAALFQDLLERIEASRRKHP